MTQAVLAAQDYVRPGECVLFSPGGASFDQYQNFAARGDAFIDAVHRLT